MKRAIRNAKDKIPVAFILPNEMRVASQTHCNIGGSSEDAVGECYGPRWAVLYSTGCSVSVPQRQLPSLAFWKAKDFSIVRR